MCDRLNSSCVRINAFFAFVLEQDDDTKCFNWNTEFEKGGIFIKEFLSTFSNS